MWQSARCVPAILRLDHSIVLTSGWRGLTQRYTTPQLGIGWSIALEKDKDRYSMLIGGGPEFVCSKIVVISIIIMFVRCNMCG